MVTNTSYGGGTIRVVGGVVTSVCVMLVGVGGPQGKFGEKGARMVGILLGGMGTEEGTHAWAL